MIEKTFISASELLRDSFMLGRKIIESGFRPDFIVGVWRGGTPVGIAVQELLEYAGISTDHVAIRTSYYRGIADTSDAVQVHGLGYLIRKLDREDKLLIVDDVLDSGRSIEAIVDEFKKRYPEKELPAQVVYYLPARSQAEDPGWIVAPSP